MKSPLKMFKGAETTGQLLRAFRENFNLTQKEVAKICGIEQANLSAIENDSRKVGADVALKLSALMGIDPSIILFPQGFDQEPEYINVKTAAAQAFKKAK